jgi:hypothetical protein
MYTEKDCNQDIELWNTELMDQYLIMKPDFFKAEFKDEKYQIVQAKGGFGCTPGNLGSAIFVTELCENPETYRINRNSGAFYGIAKDSVVAAHKAKYCK